MPSIGNHLPSSLRHLLLLRISTQKFLRHTYMRHHLVILDLARDSSRTIVRTAVEEETPCVIPYFAARMHTTPVDVDVIEADEYISLLRAQVMNLPLGDWHSQCVVGTASKEGRDYWVAVQSWHGYRLTLYPILTLEQLKSSLSAELFTKYIAYKPCADDGSPFALDAGPAVYSSMTSPLKDAPLTKV